MNQEPGLYNGLDVVPNSVIIINKKGIIQYVNPATEKLFLYNSDELPGKNISQLMPAPDALHHDKYIDNYVKSREAHIIGKGREVKGLKKDGTTFPMHLSVGELTDTEEQSFIGVIVDLTRQKLTENILLLSEERSTLAQRFANIGYWDWTIATGDLFWSEQIAPMFGYENGKVETTYENFLKAIHPDDRNLVTSAVNDSVANGAEYEIEHRVVWPNGNIRWLLERGDIIRDHEKKPLRMLGVVQDVTTRKKLETELIRAKEQAESGARAKSTFLANMSHEIRTPMNSIIGFIEISLENNNVPKEVLSYLHTARNSAKSLLTLINDILDVSKMEAGKLDISYATFYLPEFLKELLQTFETKASEKNIDLKLELDPELFICIISDSGRLRQILINIIGNSIKFTHKGRVTLLVQKNKNEQGALLFSIQDTGIGMTESQISRIFEPFTQADETTSRRFGGTGLGTTISKQLIELMNGEIWAESKENQGTTFFISLPVTLPECASHCQIDCDKHRSIGESNVPQLKKSYRILLAEDITENATLATIRLEQQGSVVELARNGKEAVDMFNNNNYDIVLMDVQMPQMDGIEATMLIRKLEKNQSVKTPVIALTASVMKEDIEKCMNAGMDAIVGKPIDFSELFKVIQEYGKKSQAKKIDKKEVVLRTSDSVKWPVPFEGINLERGIQMWQDQTLYAKVLIDFKIKYDVLMIDIGKCINKHHDYKRAHELTHALKGVSGNLALYPLCDLAQILNSSLKSNKKQDDRNIELNFEAVLSAYNIVSNNISKIEYTKRKKHGNKIAQNKENIINEINNLILFLEKGEIDQTLIETVKYSVEHFIDELLFEKLESFINAYQFTEAIELLKEINKTFAEKSTAGVHK